MLSPVNRFDEGTRILSSSRPPHTTNLAQSFQRNRMLPGSPSDQVLFGSNNKRPNPWLLAGLGALSFLGISTWMSSKSTPSTPTPPGTEIVQDMSDAENLVLLNPRQVQDRVEAGKVRQIVIEMRNGIVQWRLDMNTGRKQYWIFNPTQEGYQDLARKLSERNMIPRIEDQAQAGAIFWALLLNFGPLLLIGYFMFRMLQSRGGGGIGALNMDKTEDSDGRSVPHTTLDDVQGMPEVVKEIKSDIIDLFANRKSLVGEKLPKGILLEGPPGTGKTLLARAIAGELNRPFFSTGGSGFVELFVGMGARRVRDLFEKAKKSAPSVIFIDEIDAVGKKRGSGMSLGGNDEREQTLNEILKQMDGFESSQDVLVIAATNRIDVLDDALIRPGRFDKHYSVMPPMDPKGREAILKVHLKGKRVDPKLDTLLVARKMWPGASGAEIKQVVDEGALLARKAIQNGRKESYITQEDLLKAIEKISIGLPKEEIAFTPEDKRRVAVHEVLGHAIVGWALGIPPNVITIIPRNIRGIGTALGLVGMDPAHMPRYHITRDYIEKRACMMLAGRAAEEAYYKDKDKISTGASNDWEQVNGWMKKAVESWIQYPELFGNIIILENNNPYAASGVSDARRAEAERIRDQLITGLYEMTRVFIDSIPPESRDKLLKEIEEKETINDPKEIEQLFNNAGVDWKKLWDEKAGPLRSKF